jgi:[CysO sulfur-carrier protein]-S-L-cysteine hydrolase
MASVPEPAPDPLEIPAAIVDQMIAHCQREAPREACGMLGGVGSRVVSFHPLTNVAASEKVYLADKRELLIVNRAIRESGQEILALYHSHPRSIATPSKTDLLENYWGEVPRIIVSLVVADKPDVRIWRLRPDSFEELPWRTTE